MSTSQPVRTATPRPSLRIRRSAERGHANHGWLDSHHTFSFAGYFDPKHMGFRSLRVINEDRVAPAQGFGTHPHQDMEIVTVVLEGALEHKDSMGTGSVIRRGDVQRMTAGTGVTHSEYNHAKDAPVHFFQIWVVPGKKGLAPSYEQKNFSGDARRGKLCLVASRDGREGSVTIHQDVSLYASDLPPNAEASHDLGEGRAAWIQVAEGVVVVNGEELRAGDGAAIEGAGGIGIRAQTESEFLLFDLG